MLGLDRSMSQPNLLHLAQLAAAAPISACGSEISESIASQNDIADIADLPALSSLSSLPGALRVVKPALLCSASISQLVSWRRSLHAA